LEDSTRRDKKDKRSGEKLAERKGRKLQEYRSSNSFLNKGTREIN
jgi:hypothetical protein